MHSSNDPSDSANTDNASPKRSKPRRGRGRRKPPRGGGLALTIESERLGICRLPAKNRIPIWVHRSSFYTVSRSRDELSIVCEERLVPKSVRCEVGWRAIRVKEPLDPSLVGVLASLANPLTDAGVSIFSISTYDTDYLLVRQKKLNRARQVLEDAGHRFLDEDEVEERNADSQDVESHDAEPQAADHVSLPEAESKTAAPPTPPPEEPDVQGEEPKVRKRRRRRGSRAQEKTSAVAASVDDPPSPVGEESKSADSTSQESESDANVAAAEDTTAEGERPRRRRRRRRSRGAGSSADASRGEAAETRSDDSGSAEGAAGDDVSSRAAEPQVAGAGAGTLAASSQDVRSSEETPEANEAASDSSTVEEKPDGASAVAAGTEAEDPSESMLAQSTRRRSLRSAERLKRLSQALRQFGASLTSDPRFSGSSNATAEPAAETNEASTPVVGQPEPESSESEVVASKEEADARAEATRAPQASNDASRAEGDELDLDWESELVARADDANPDGDSSAEVVAAEASPEPSAEASAEESQASKMAAFQGESLSLAAEEDDGDGEVDEDGLYTGAIPQGDVEVTDQSFATLGLSDAVLEAVRQMGFEHPTPIQAAVVPEALEGVDIIGLAETGSGKTAAFVLPLAERLYHGKGIRGLIICPTREIALQTKSFIDAFGRNHKLRAVAVIGGVKMGPQIDRLRSRPDILVATPGRLADHLRRGNVDLNRLEELVIDEADHMLDLGFLPQIKEILQQVPKQRRCMMFSATMLPEIERLAQQFMNEPLTIDIRPVNRVAEGIEHRLYLVHDADLKTCLLRLLDEVQGSTLIFARRKLHTEWLARQLQQAGWPADRIHSDRTQAQRVRALRGFREGKFRILVATDVAARGIDVPRIQHVINYGLPESVSDYVHRAGRTARGNSVGIVSSIGTWQDKPTVREIESTLGTEIPRCELEGIEAYVERRPRRKTVRRRRLL